MPPQQNLDASIKQLIGEIQNLAKAIGGMSEQETGDLGSKIAGVMQEQYETLKRQADEQGQTLDIYTVLKDAAKKAVKQEEKIGKIDEEILKSMRAALDASKKTKTFYSKLTDIEKKIIKTLGTYYINLEQQQKDSIKLAKTDITSLLKKMESMGFLGKIIKLIATSTVFGKEDSKRREKVARNIAIKMHPETFAGEKAGGIGAMIGLFGKWASVTAIMLPILKAIFDNLMKIAEVPAKLVKTTGFTAANIDKMAKGLIESSVQLKYFGIEMDDLYVAASALSEEFKNVDQVTQQSIDTITILSRLTGVSANQLARVYRIMNVNWKMSDYSIKSFSKTLRDQAGKYGLSFNEIVKDIAANAENLSMYFHGSVDALRQAAVRAAQLGTSISSQVTITQKFSHWADAIQNSFMLSAITGKQFNASLLYTKAALGDTAGVVEEIFGNLQKSGKTWQQIVPMAQAVSETLGIPFEEIRRIMEGKAGRTGPKSMTEMSAEEFGKAMGLPEIMSPQEQIMKGIGGLINELLTSVSKYLVPEVIRIANFIVGTESNKTKYGSVAGRLADLGDFITGRQGSRLGGYFGTKGFETFQHGGVSTSPSVVSEFGQPEAVLPFSGPGRKSFTEPFLASSAIEPFAREIKEAIMSMTRIPLEVKVYLDSEVLAEKIEHYTYMQSTR